MRKVHEAVRPPVLVIALGIASILCWPITPAGAAAGKINGSGTVVCDALSGTVQFSPGLQDGTLATGTVRVTLKGTSCGVPGESTGDGLSVTQVTIKGSGTFSPTLFCFAGQYDQFQMRSYVVTYVTKRGTPKLTPTTIDSGAVVHGMSSTQSATLTSQSGSGSFTAFHSVNAVASIALLSGGLCSKTWTADPRGSFLAIS